MYIEWEKTEYIKEIFKYIINKIINQEREGVKQLKNDEYSYLPLELVTAAEQFLKPGLTARFLDEFPFADVLEAAEIFEKFYPHKKSGQSKK